MFYLLLTNNNWSILRYKVMFSYTHTLWNDQTYSSPQIFNTSLWWKQLKFSPLKAILKYTLTIITILCNRTPEIISPVWNFVPQGIPKRNFLVNNLLWLKIITSGFRKTSIVQRLIPIEQMFLFLPKWKVKNLRNHTLKDNFSAEWRKITE